MDYSEVNELLRSQILRSEFSKDNQSSIKIRPLSSNEISDISEFIYNPTNKGLWRLNGKWIVDSKIIKLLDKQIDDYFKSNKKTKLKVGDLDLNITQEKITEIKKDNSFYKFSFYFSLYYYIYLIDKSKKDSSVEKDLLSFVPDVNYLILFQLLDIEKIKSEFKDSYDVFINDIFYENMNTIVGNNVVSFAKGYAVFENFYANETPENAIDVFSIDKESIDIIKKFYLSMELLENITIERIFSPEKFLIDRYIVFLNICYRNIIKNVDYKQLIEKAIIEVYSNRYPQCVTLMGILGEHILTNIYESLFREKLDDDLSLGDIYQKINEDTKKIINPHKQSIKIDAPDLFKDMTNFKDKTQLTNEELKDDVAKLLQKLLQYVKEQDENINKKINKQQYLEASIFPNNFRTNYKFLLKYRNGVSHKSAIEVNKFEAIKTIYCAVNLLIWWNKEKLLIDWDKSIEDIIKKIKERNNPSI